MVRYRVGARFSYLASGILLMILGIVLPIIFFASAGTNGTYGLGFLSVFVIGAIMFSVEMVFQVRRNYAMKGEAVLGRIIDIEKRWHWRSGFRYSLIIAYHTSDGEGVEASIPISSFDKDRYQRDTQITVHVNGKYGYINKY